MKKKRSKRFEKLKKSMTKKSINSIDDSIKMIKSGCTTKFDESIDVSFRLNLKQKKEEINLRTNVNLPNGNGKKVRVAVLCEESKALGLLHSYGVCVGIQTLAACPIICSCFDQGLGI